MYLCKFDSVGKRISTVVSGIHFNTDEEKQAYLDDGYIETSAEDYAYYVGNKGNGANGTGYVRGTNGKPTDAPPYTPPKPTKEEKLATLDSEYEQAKADIFEAYQTAVLMGDTDLQTAIQADFAELNADYAEERAAIING